MNGYLNNLTMRTLNTGNRVEPRLPALFEPRAFESKPGAESLTSFEEDVTTVSESSSAPVKERISSEAPSHGPSVAQPELEERAVAPRSRAVKPAEDLETQFEPVFHEEEQEDPVETLTVQASLQPRSETVEIPTPVKDAVTQRGPILEEIEERLTPSFELDDSVLPAPVSRIQSQNQPVTSHRVPKKNPEPSVLPPTRSPQTDDFQTQLTVRRTTPPSTADSVVAPIEMAFNEEISEAEERVTNRPEQKPEPEFESITQPYQRVNPTPATWRDNRQQHWRRRQSTVPVESEPSINVTIGRIEVRAVPADNRKATPRRSESPVMPLEDYLRKQRRGGER